MTATDAKPASPLRRRVTAVILAGGSSQRFGADKAFALWNGEPYLARVAKAVQPVVDAFLVLAPAGAKPLPYARLVPGATILPDKAPGLGPVEALRGALPVILSPTVLVVPCDAPGLPTGLARHLVAACEETGQAAVAIPPTGPLYSLFAIPKALLAERLPRAKRLEGLLRDAQPVETEAEGLNVNEPPRT